ncbi:polysaccharide pyruvyl transferase family protein [Coralloluteibacterium stylophorae]|uniref:Polysaccharide pyruvyl transferase family protein n=2 Tax=Coralloluteibacterium stylophorae TaxID=1776034 RepID=A0AAP2C8J7_9GAMM|nr:polysaccharide pyruvyl transferase family protein [Coralloluteibacterium stylophorae]MBS7455869.1 polysaccharide pyruvyl transferase family protein [Coralloluteibacterium stylophorae]
MKRIAIFSVKYSANLGDGLLSECLEREILRQRPDTHIVPLDLAGRSGYGTGSRHRGKVLRVLEALPGPVRRLAVAQMLGMLVRSRLRPRWRRALARVDGAILGGGNLIADADLNFPFKVNAALGETARRSLPVAVFAVGVSDNWTRRGHRLFADAFRRSRMVRATVRDERSRSVWNRRLRPEEVPPASLARDPGVLTADHFPARANAGYIALGLTDPVLLQYHATGPSDFLSLDDWLVEVVAALRALGRPIRLFTNGSPEDRDYLERLTPRLQEAAPGLVAAEPAFADPDAFAGFVSASAFLMAHRMHACIAAWSYRVPHVGFSWDIKLNSFFESVGRGEWVVDPAELEPAALLALVARGLGEGIDEAGHARVVAEARRDVGAILGALESAVAAPTAGRVPVVMPETRDSRA